MIITSNVPSRYKLTANSYVSYARQGKETPPGRRWRLLGYKTCLDTKPVLYQVRFCIFHRSYKTRFVPKRVNTKPV